MSNSKPLPPVEVLQAYFDYCPETGRLSRKGKTVECGTVHASGYRQVGFQYQHYQAHRIAWCLHYGAAPPEEVDHKNGDRLDNRISNLRLATRRQNARNGKRRVTNKSGFKGVVLRKSGKWRACIGLNHGKILLGDFESPEEAHAAYCAAAAELHGEFARTA